MRRRVELAGAVRLALARCGPLLAAGVHVRGGGMLALSRVYVYACVCVFVFFVCVCVRLCV